MMILRLSILLLALADSGHINAGGQSLSLQHGGVARSYQLHLPDNISPEKPTALLLVLHGRNGSGRRMASLTGFNERANQHGFVVAYPDSIDGRWNYLHGIPGAAAGPDDPGFLIALTDLLSETYKIDPEQRYLVGLSNGGFMAQRVACDAGNRFSAFASVAAGGYAALPGNCRRREPIDALYLHGTADELVPWEGRGIQDATGHRQLVTLSIKHSLQFWSVRNGCEGSLDVREVAPSGRSAGTRVQVLSSRDCLADAQVKLYAIIGGGHNWPGVVDVIPAAIAGRVNLDIHASDVAWSFFNRHHAIP